MERVIVLIEKKSKSELQKAGPLFFSFGFGHLFLIRVNLFLNLSALSPAVSMAFSSGLMASSYRPQFLGNQSERVPLLFLG